MRHYLIAGTVVAASFLLPTSASACNDCGGTATGAHTGSGGEVVVSNVSQSPGSDGSTGPGAPGRQGDGSGPPVVCQVYDLGVARANHEEVADALDPGSIAGGTSVWQVCFDAVTGDALYSGEVTWATGQAAPLVPPRVLADRARAQLHLPRPVARTWPAPDRQVVQVPVWLHADNFQAASQTASAGPVSATVRAEPVSVDWSMGDGGSMSCASAGASYGSGATDSDCTYTFATTSARQPGQTFSGSVSITWHLTWDSNVGESGDLGLVVLSTPVAWRVEQIQSLITNEGTP